MTAPIVDPNDPNLPSNQPPTPNSTEIPPSSNNGGAVETARDQAGFELFRSVLGEKERRIQELQQQLNTREVPKDSRPQWDQFTETPVDVIRREVAEQVKPINDFVLEMKKTTLANNIKAQLRNQPQYARVLALGEGYVDQVLATMPQITIDSVMVACNIVAGKLAMGELQPLGTYSDPSPTPTPTPAPKIVPPHTPPSATPVTRQPNNKQEEKPWENLSENELRLARHYGMTPEQYWKSQQGDVLVVGGKK